MKRHFGRFALLALFISGCGGNGATQFGGNPPTGTRHFDLQCTICHAPGVTPGKEQAGQPLPTCNIAACHQHDGFVVHHRSGLGSACTDCHMGHQSSNLYLVREEILTAPGQTRLVEFTNLNGVSDGGFVSITPPVRGVCQVCHTTTQFYRQDGTGSTHYTFPCYTCHEHMNGFIP